MSNLVSSRLDLELMMRQVLGLEQRLSELTNQSPDYTDGKLVPVSLAELEVRATSISLYDSCCILLATRCLKLSLSLNLLFQLEFPFLNWTEFLVRGFQIIDHPLDPGLTVLVDREYLQVGRDLSLSLSLILIHHLLPGCGRVTVAVAG